MGNKLRRFYRLVVIVVLFSAGLLAAWACFPLADKLAARRCGDIRRSISCLWLRALRRSLGLHIYSQGCFSSAANVLVSNHISWLDIVVLGQLGPVNFVAKDEVARWPVVGFLAARTGTLFIRRGDRRSGREVGERMAWCLRRGERVAFFPEGTTGNGESVLPFHSALFQPAVITGAVIQPVTLSYRGMAGNLAPFIGDDEFVPHLVNLLGLKRIEVTVQFCAPLKAAGMERAAVADLSHQRIQSALWANGVGSRAVIRMTDDR